MAAIANFVDDVISLANVLPCNWNIRYYSLFSYSLARLLCQSDYRKSRFDVSTSVHMGDSLRVQINGGRITHYIYRIYAKSLQFFILTHNFLLHYM